jgi:hypothetical protein
VNYPDADVTESVRSAVMSAIVIRRRIKQAITELEESNPDSALLSEYRRLHSTVLRKLQNCRERTEFILRCTDVTLADLEVVATYLRHISFVESESEGGGGTAH